MANSSCIAGVIPAQNDMRTPWSWKPTPRCSCAALALALGCHVPVAVPCNSSCQTSARHLMLGCQRQWLLVGILSPGYAVLATQDHADDCIAPCQKY